MMMITVKRRFNFLSYAFHLTFAVDVSPSRFTHSLHSLQSYKWVLKRKENLAVMF